MEYIRYFEEHSDHQAFIDSNLFGYAKLSYCEEEEDVVYRQYKEFPYLTFIAEEDNCTIQLNRITTAGTIVNLLKYSLDEGETWSNYTFTKQSTNGYSGQTISLQKGDFVMFKGTLPQGKFRFVMSGKIYAAGDITCLYNETGGDIPLTSNMGYMFQACTGLTSAPNLPSTTLCSGCYISMFDGCKSLKEGPYLPATDLKSESYRYMFQGCSSMTRIPDFTVNTLEGSHCLHAMFYNCSNLKDAKITLNPTKLVPNCYHELFRNCSSLENGPSVLPATTLDNYCYRYMFSGCTSLEIAPDILAINLSGDYPLSYMFIGCSRLRYIKAMFTTTPSSTYTPGWTRGVSPTGIFIKNSSATWNVTGENGIPTGWTVQTASS